MKNKTHQLIVLSSPDKIEVSEYSCISSALHHAANAMKRATVKEIRVQKLSSK